MSSKNKELPPIEDWGLLEHCPCDICSSQDDEFDLLQRQKLDEICDVYSNELIDYLIENPKKGILKKKIKNNIVEE